MPFSCKTSSRLPFCRPRVSGVFFSGANSCSRGNVICMQQSVDALSVWMCSALELGEQGQSCCWPWRSVVWLCALRVSTQGCFQHRFQTSLSFSSLEVRQPGSRQLQAGEGEMKRTSECTCSKQKVREAERLCGCVQLLV